MRCSYELQMSSKSLKYSESVFMGFFRSSGIQIRYITTDFIFNMDHIIII